MIDATPEAPTLLPGARPDIAEVKPSFRTGRVVILGRPNAGKSTLLNALLEVGLSATSKRPQTTRTNIRGIIQRYNKKKEWSGQLVLVDTPGVNFKKGLLDRSMHMSVEDALRSDIDVVVWVADARTFARDLKDVELGRPGSDKLAGWLKHRLGLRPDVTWVLALSKADAMPKNELLPVMERAAKILPEFKQIVPIAAQLGLKEKDSNLDSLLAVLDEASPRAKPLYAEDEWTDLSSRQVLQNLIREALFRQGREEVPYQSDATIIQFKEPEGQRKMNEIDATIWVAKNSLKPILVGKAGSMIREIGHNVRARYKEVTGEDIVLRLLIKVVDKWDTRASSLQELGYVLD